MWILALLLGLVVGFVLGFIVAVNIEPIPIKRMIIGAAKTGTPISFNARYFKITEINSLQGEDIGGPK